MDTNQTTNFDKLSYLVGKTIFDAWSHLLLLEGFQEGAKSKPNAIHGIEDLFETIFRANHIALNSLASSLIDKTSSTCSLLKLAQMVKRDGNEIEREQGRAVEAELISKTGPFQKIANWRQKVHSHLTLEGQSEAFYTANKLGLTELSDALYHLDLLLNKLTGTVKSECFDTKAGNAHIRQEGIELFNRLAIFQQAQQ